MKFSIENAVAFLQNSSNEHRVHMQQSSVDLLFEAFGRNQKTRRDSHIESLQKLLGGKCVFPLTSLQEEIYYADNCTAFVPPLVKKTLLAIKSRFVIRPLSLKQLEQAVRYSAEHRLHYTIRGAGTWPFGGAIPMHDDIIIDTSYLDFYRIYPKGVLAIAAGVIFANLRQALCNKGFSLRNDITNPNSGTVCGWLATGGFGLGAYKYGHVKNSLLAVLLLSPDGNWHTLRPGDELFDLVCGSEGQLGIIAGAVLAIEKLSYADKPCAFSFPNLGAAHSFLRRLTNWNLKPSTVIYFDSQYMNTTGEIFRERVEKKISQALENKDDQALDRARHELEMAPEFTSLKHVVVMAFDTREDYLQTLKYLPFISSDERHRYKDIVYKRLGVDLAHELWKHRYLPVEMKQKGPLMLLCEMIIPLEHMVDYIEFLRSTITFWTQNPVKFEVHLIGKDQLLVQSIILADPNVRRHLFYFGMVPLIIEFALYLGGRLYGVGAWNLPFAKLDRSDLAARMKKLAFHKKKLDTYGLVNRVKFINPIGRRLSLRIFSMISALILPKLVKLLVRGMTAAEYSIYWPGRLLWRISKKILPFLIPPAAKGMRNQLLALAAPCAECDSCERVCPTSDVFGFYGPATPITRRKIAVRLACKRKISREDALGFLACTRCNNCSRVCPTEIDLSALFDLVEENNEFKKVLELSERQKKDFIERFWEIVKESPLYRKHTLSDNQESRSHLQHGLKILHSRGFAYAKLFIDPQSCIRCGMCTQEHSCMYGAREGKPREIPMLIDKNCSLCNACINFCPQNKLAQKKRYYLQKRANNAVDIEEKKYWERELRFLRDTTSVKRSARLSEMADGYFTGEILMEIDEEATSGNIPISGMGQGDRHMGIGFDAERFSHFHIVGPAQNRLHEGDPNEELSVILGKRHRYCKFDCYGKMHNPPYPKLKLSPFLYAHLPLSSGGRVELALIKTAADQNSLVVIELGRLLECYDFFRKQGGYHSLPAVIVPRVDCEVIQHIQVSPHTQRDFLLDLWKMPAFELPYHENIEQTVAYIRESVTSLGRSMPLLFGCIDIAEHQMIGTSRFSAQIEGKIEKLLSLGFDILHIHGLRNRDNYFVTSQAVRILHHYLLASGRRHTLSIVASGGIRLASDSQKTIQRGAEATLLDICALLALDPACYQAILDGQTTTRQLMDLDIDWAMQRLSNQAESRKVQVLEVLGASGFKDIKKTVGEEGRLIDFYCLEERIQKEIFANEPLEGKRANRQLMEREGKFRKFLRYSELKERVQTLEKPHHFYQLGEENQEAYRRDHVWPGRLIETIGKMACGDQSLFYLKNAQGTGLLGDGFDVMKILYIRDPDMVPESELEEISTSVSLDKGLVLDAPWMFGGKSVGSIGLDSWKAHVIAAYELGIQFDTGEGGYPTSFFLDGKGEPIFFEEHDIERMKPFFHANTSYTVEEIEKILERHIDRKLYPQPYLRLSEYPAWKPFLFYVAVERKHQFCVSTELKTGLFGVTKESIKKARRVVIAYSQGAKMGIGGHILAQKVNRLVSYLRGVEGRPTVNLENIQKLVEKIEKIAAEDNPLTEQAKKACSHLRRAQDEQQVFSELYTQLRLLEQQCYQNSRQGKIDAIESAAILSLCESAVSYVYSSIISPFPFHNCYSIEDVKAFIDAIRMINPKAAIAIKVSPSIDIEFIATGLARIAKDNNREAMIATKGKRRETEKYTMSLEIWIDGPRGGTGASPNIIKGQMGMHLEYAILLVHHRLLQDGLRDDVKIFVSGGIRTYEDVVKSVALGADGVIWGTAPLVAIGCDRNRNCHNGCSRGIATSNLVMQKLRNVEINAKQMVNAFLIMQMQVIRALGGLGLKDIRELRGRYDKIQWIGLKERVDFRIRQHKSFEESVHPLGRSNCGVAAVIADKCIPSHVLDHVLGCMKNRGMDGVGVGKTLCFPNCPDHYALRIMVKGITQPQWEAQANGENRKSVRIALVDYRVRLAEQIRRVFLDPYFDFHGSTKPNEVREPYKVDEGGNERDFREFGGMNTDPGDIFCWFVRVKPHILDDFIKNELLQSKRYAYIREYFPNALSHNYRDKAFVDKAENLLVFELATRLTQTLYVWEATEVAWERLLKRNLPNSTEVLACEKLDECGLGYLKSLRDFIAICPQLKNQGCYLARKHKVAAVMSCGKNFAVWKTAGREIPWQTPPAPNNIIHVRLATGSAVEQMNAHPFAKLHTALTHNGETTNYQALKQRVEQFGLASLASTDTEVAALKFHLLAEELEYPDLALFESFSPTTGDDLKLIDRKLRQELEEIQRVEFSSSPDGPYQYLCLRHLPQKNITERIDLKDPADLRPSVTALWLDSTKEKKRTVSIIASEEQALAAIMCLLDKEGVVDGAFPDYTFVSDGMISRARFDSNGQVTSIEFVDRYGEKIDFADPGRHYSLWRNDIREPKDAKRMSEELQDEKQCIIRNLANYNFNDYRWVIEKIITSADEKTVGKTIDLLSYLFDYMRTFNTGDKAKSSLLDITRSALFCLFDRAPQLTANFVKATFGKDAPEKKDGILLIDATKYLAQGTDPHYCLGAMLGQAYHKGWRRYVLYNVNGQRLISSAVMGEGNSDEVSIDVYGTPGEYAGAFMQGGELRIHGNAQNFTGMCMHHGSLVVYGNAGKVCGYASKGGSVFILGDISDRAWTNSVDDIRCQKLEVHVLGSAGKYAGESLMGGDFFFAGLYFDPRGRLCVQKKPYRGSKMLGGASSGRILLFDPYQRLHPHQHAHGKKERISDWSHWQKMVLRTLEMAGAKMRKEKDTIEFFADGKAFSLTPENFALIVPRGGLKGYDCH